MLTSRGIAKTDAIHFASTYSKDQLLKTLDWFDQKKEAGEIKESPSGFLWTVLQKRGGPSDDFISTEERKKREEKARAQQEAQKRREKEEEYQKWQAMPEDEKIKGHLIVWEQRFKREQDREPTREEREAKRQELISGLPELEKKMFGDLVEKKVEEPKQKDKPVRPRKKRTEKPVERTQKTKPTHDTTQAPKVQQKPSVDVSETTQDSSRSPKEKIKKIEPSAGIKHQLDSKKTITRQTRASFFVRMVKKLPFGRRIAQALEDHNVV